MKPAGQPYDPSYEAQMLRAHEMALRGNAGQQALTETHAKAIDVLSQADQRNTSGNFKLKVRNSLSLRFESLADSLWWS